MEDYIRIAMEWWDEEEAKMQQAAFEELKQKWLDEEEERKKQQIQILIVWVTNTRIVLPGRKRSPRSTLR